MCLKLLTKVLTYTGTENIDISIDADTIYCYFENETHPHSFECVPTNVKYEYLFPYSLSSLTLQSNGK